MWSTRPSVWSNIARGGNDLHQSMCHIQLHLMAVQTTFSATAIILEPQVISTTGAAAKETIGVVDQLFYETDQRYYNSYQTHSGGLVRLPYALTKCVPATTISSGQSR